LLANDPGRFTRGFFNEPVKGAGRACEKIGALLALERLSLKVA